MCDHQIAYEQCKSYNLIDIKELQDTAQSRGNARIMRGYHLSPDNVTIGVKRISVKPTISLAESQAALRREIAVWCTLKNPNVLELLGTVTFGVDRPYALYLSQAPVFYYYENGDLVQFLAQNQLNNSNKLNLFKDIAVGINHIHDHKIVHGDLKHANVLIDHERRAKICDFGSAFVREGCSTCLAGPPDDTQALTTHIYLSPEIWDLEEQISYQSDIWALGCLLFEVQTGERVYNGRGKSDKQIMSSMIAKELPATIEDFSSDEFSQAIGQVAVNCLSPEPQDRLTAQEILQRLDGLTPW